MEQEKKSFVRILRKKNIRASIRGLIALWPCPVTMEWNRAHIKIFQITKIVLNLALIKSVHFGLNFVYMYSTVHRNKSKVVSSTKHLFYIEQMAVQKFGYFIAMKYSISMFVNSTLLYEKLCAFHHYLVIGNKYKGLAFWDNNFIWSKTLAINQFDWYHCLESKL